MAKDKLITVRISNEIYDQFKAWTESNNSNISQCLREYILDCLNLNQSSQNIDSNIDNNLYRQLENEVKKLSSQVEQLEDSLYNRLYNSLVNGLSSQNIDSSIDIIDTGNVTAISAPDVPEKPEALIQSDSENLPDENKLKTEEIAEGIITPKTKNKGNKDDSERAINVDTVLSGKQLLKRLGKPSNDNFLSRYRENLENITKSVDPDHISWKFSHKKGNANYYKPVL